MGPHQEVLQAAAGSQTSSWLQYQPDEERILHEVAFSRPKWQVAAHHMRVLLSTTMGFGELRHVRRRDVDLKRKWIIERWEQLGGSHDSDFILPHRPRTLKGPGSLRSPGVPLRQRSMAYAKKPVCRRKRRRSSASRTLQT